MTRPKIPLGSLEPEEYETMRSALRAAEASYIRKQCQATSQPEAQTYCDLAARVRTLRARFGKRGRK